LRACCGSKSAAVAAFRSAKNIQEAQGAIEEQIQRSAEKRTFANRIGREIVRGKQQLETHISEREALWVEPDENLAQARAVESLEAPNLRLLIGLPICLLLAAWTLRL
jgi:hypothetical protein